MTPTIRRLTVDDWRENRVIRLEALGSFPGNYFTTLDAAQARSDDQWRGQLMSATLVVFGLFDGDVLAGITAIARDAPDEATLAMSYIREGWRGRGLSAMLYAARLDWARANGIRRVCVSHSAGNDPSRRAIERHGFARVDAVPHDWPDRVRVDDVRYVLDLA